LVIGRTYESATLPQHLGGRVEGKSSIARIGLFVHISAPTIHPGFDNRIALEFYNVGPLPIRVRPGDPICQLILERVEGEGLYQGQFQS
jgi:dCTP deaminase